MMIRSRPLFARCIRQYSTIPTQSSSSTAKSEESKEINSNNTTNESSIRSRPPPRPRTQTQREQVTQRQKIELAQAGIKDIFDGFLTTEESFEPIDTKPILANPRLFNGLSEFHKNQVKEEVEKRLRRNWNDVAVDSKKMAYYIAYGNYGPREDLTDNLYSNHIPEDLPFALPTQAKISQSSTDKVKKLPPVDLDQINEVRRKRWNDMTRKLDPITKFVVYFAVVVSLIALYRDKFIEEETLTVPESALLIADMEREQELQSKKEKEEVDLMEKGKEEERKNSKKWYYLWLK